MILAHDGDFVHQMENIPNLGELLARNSRMEQGSYVVLIRSSTIYHLDRVFYDCLALNTVGPISPLRNQSKS